MTKINTVGRWLVFRSPAPTGPDKLWTVVSPLGAATRFRTWDEAWRYAKVHARATPV